MSKDMVRTTTPCAACSLRRCELFTPIEAHELALIESLKIDEIARPAGATLIAEGQTETPLYTLLDGWAFRYKSLPDGRRQILSFLLPGDFIGLQQKLTDDAAHGVEALSALRLCVFRRDMIWALHRDLPTLSHDITWLAAQEERLVDDNLLSVGRRTAVERISHLLLSLHQRALFHWPEKAGRGVWMPLTQQHLADALGLSLVHTNKTLRRLVKGGLCRWSSDQHLTISDAPGMARLAKLPHPQSPAVRPLI